MSHFVLRGSWLMEKLEKLFDVMDTLLGENGCPWDREQTHKSLRKYLLEEAAEAAEAIDSGNMDNLCEELGDVLLQVVFHAKLAEKSGAFTFDDLVERLTHKLVSRHTHVFGGDTAATVEDVKKLWEANKKKEKSG
jgi:tetrapyrrole methylase family protein/MazG family protein